METQACAVRNGRKGVWRGRYMGLVGDTDGKKGVWRGSYVVQSAVLTERRGHGLEGKWQRLVMLLLEYASPTPSTLG